MPDISEEQITEEEVRSMFPDEAFKKKRKVALKAGDEKKKIELEISRREGKTYFKFSIHSKIEEIYKKMSKEIKESQSWPGLKFYLVPQLHDETEYQQRLQNLGLFDAFGSEFYRSGRLNMAWIRTVGGKGEIEVSNAVSFAEMSHLAKNVTQFIKQYFEEYFRDYTIKGSVTVEL